LTAEQLGEFLYRVARVKDVETAEFTDLQGFTSVMEFTTRPYPGGGKLYELELYIMVGACEEISQGLYHYCPQNHHLEKLSGMTPAVKLMMNNAAGAMKGSQWPNVLITLAARFARIAWKYNTISYALIQKDVGVLSQSMYLVGTAMGLAPCMIGCSNSDLFARATGLDYYTEGAVGEFAISSKRNDGDFPQKQSVRL
jgi:SagB-type dehydrogenase family enzyme